MCCGCVGTAAATHQRDGATTATLVEAAAVPVRSISTRYLATSASRVPDVLRMRRNGRGCSPEGRGDYSYTGEGGGCSCPQRQDPLSGNIRQQGV